MIKMNPDLVLSLLMLLVMIVEALTDTSERCRFCLMVVRWVKDFFHRLKPKGPLYIKRTNIIITSSCEICGKSPSTAVTIRDREQINVCQACLDRQLAKGLWKEDA
jgi:hypothetical protein